MVEICILLSKENLELSIAEAETIITQFNNKQTTNRKSKQTTNKQQTKQ